MLRKSWRILAVGIFCVASLCATPVVYDFNGSVNDAVFGPLSAEAVFWMEGSNLKILLVNTGSADVTQPNQVLTALFFNIAGNPTLTKGSVILPLGSEQVVSDYLNLTGSSSWTCPGVKVGPGPAQPCSAPTLINGPGSVVGGEFGYATNSPLMPGGTYYGVSSAGLGIFGPTSVFAGGNLWDTVSPGGGDYGITSKGDNLKTGNADIVNNPLIKYSALFTFGTPQGFNPASISGVVFQYGTALDGPHFGGGGGQPPPVPEPGTWVMMGAGLLGLGLLRRRKRT